MHARRQALAAIAGWTLLASAACTDGASDIDTTDTSEDAAPDLAGTYAVVFTPGDACTGATEWIGDSLVVSGEASTLSFDFGGDVVLDGSVDTAFAFEFHGPVTSGDADWDVSGSGVAYTQDDLWVLDGDVEISSVGVDSPCTATGTLQATQGS